MTWIINEYRIAVRGKNTEVKVFFVRNERIITVIIPRFFGKEYCGAVYLLCGDQAFGIDVCGGAEAPDVFVNPRVKIAGIFSEV